MAVVRQALMNFIRTREVAGRKLELPMYHFNIHRADEVLIDDVGEELSDIQTAQNRAIEISCGIFCDSPLRERAEVVAIDVLNEGKSVMRILATVRVEMDA